MAGKRGDPSKKYPQIVVSRELYDEIRELKFELKVDSMGDVINRLIEEHLARKGKK
jgi:predicted CopG family antitoxin